MRKTEEEREAVRSGKAVARYELGRRRISYGEEDLYGSYKASISDYVMLDFGSPDGSIGHSDGRHWDPGVSNGNGESARGREERVAGSLRGKPRGDRFEVRGIEEDR